MNENTQPQSSANILQSRSLPPFYAKKKTSSCRELCDTVPFNEADLLRNDDILIYEQRPKYQR